ncbi:MAG: hypothetical protein AB7F40_09035 [Victivallaceae bacterium]
MKPADRAYLIAGGWICAAGFAVLVAYLHRMAPGGWEPEPAGLHAQLVALSTRICGEGRLLGLALPTVIAGTLAVAFTYFAFGRGDVIRGLIASSLLIGCGGFIEAARHAQADTFYLAVLTAAIFAASLLPVALRRYALLGWMLVWMLFGWSGWNSEGLTWWRNFGLYALPGPLAVICGAGFACELAHRKPEWRTMLAAATVLLAAAPGRVWFYSLPLAVWCAAEALTSPRLKWRKYLVGLLAAVPWAALAGFAAFYFYCRDRHPGYDMPLMIPAVTLAVAALTPLATRGLKIRWRICLTVLSASAASVTVFVMVLEPFRYFLR